MNNQIEQLCGLIEVKLKDIENGRESEVEVTVGLIEKLRILDLKRGAFYYQRLEEGLRCTRKWFFQMEQESLSKNQDEFLRVQEKMKTVQSIIKDCAGTVSSQAGMLDRIDSEVDLTFTSSKKAFFELETTKSTQKSCKTCVKFTLMTAFILTILIFFLFLFS